MDRLIDDFLLYVDMVQELRLTGTQLFITFCAARGFSVTYTERLKTALIHKGILSPMISVPAS